MLRLNKDKYHSSPDLVSFIDVNLKLNPFPRKGNRIESLGEGLYLIAIKTFGCIIRLKVVA